MVHALKIKRMKKSHLLLVLSILLHFKCINLIAQDCNISAVYGGGPFYNNAAITIPEIKASGFNTVIVWTIHIDAQGNLNFNAEFPIVANGKYIGTTKYPAFSKNMTLLKTPPSSVTRIEFGLSASGSSTFANIKALIAAEGTGTTSMLYKNFKALRDSMPALDALNFDDESTYDVASSVKFAVMLADIGFHVALCPYTSTTYWTNTASQTNAQRKGAVDKIFLQCYDGGAGNNPCNWNFNGIPIYPGLWDKNDSPSSVQTKMTNWKKNCSVQGGFMWLYDDFKGTASTKQYATAINTAFGIAAPGLAKNAVPVTGASNVSLTPTLTWTADNCAQTHAVYFGTTTPPPFVINQTDTIYKPATLAPNTTYYWRIDEKNFFGNSTGTIWNFKTGMATAVDDDLQALQQTAVYPNPFTTQTIIAIDVLEKTEIQVSILNQLGAEVSTLTNSKMINGKHTFTWMGGDNAGNNVSPGLYLIRIASKNANGDLKIKHLKLIYQP
jgi:hypothetical protein